MSCVCPIVTPRLWSQLPDPLLELVQLPPEPPLPPEAAGASTWADPDAYDVAAARLAKMFHDNFESYADGVSAAIADAGPGGG